MASADLREELNCSICLSVYTDPVTLRCGHNFCQVCIGTLLDTQDESGFYTCPECRKRFDERPALQKNVTLCNIVERFHSTESVKGNEEETGIYCSYCDSSVPAVKTCLMCETSLCDTHITKHDELAEHILVDPTGSVESRKCPVHKKLLEYYCTQDSVCICVSCCLVGEHRGHQLEKLNKASEKKKEKLRTVFVKLTSEREETDKKLESLQEHKRRAQEKSACVTERVTGLIRNIRERLDALEERILSEISRWEEQVSLQVSGLIQQLELKKDELSRKIRHIEELCNKTDPFTILQGQELRKVGLFEAVEGKGENPEKDDIKVPTVVGLDEVMISVILQRAISDFAGDVKEKFRLRDVTLQISVDEDTAGDYVYVSSDLKRVSWSTRDQRREASSGRFVSCQALSGWTFCWGEHYWEVETSPSGCWKVGIARECIERTGSEAHIGENEVSWCLCRKNEQYYAIHNSCSIAIPSEDPIQRIGIFFDKGSRLSFYELSGIVRHLHTFTGYIAGGNVHAAFWVHEKGWVKIGR
ncbi:E3 ubiquitin/ISG15 ligase TRIM25-like [Rhinophrynus dorsalis]